MKRLPFKRIGTGLILFGHLCLTFYIRIQGVERIPDGQFTENDAYLFHRQANIIAEQGALPARDMDRFLYLRQRLGCRHGVRSLYESDCLGGQQ